MPESTGCSPPQPQIAICTALPKELAACLVMLDSSRPVNSSTPDDPNQYWCGTMPSRGGGEPHQVLVTALSKMGNDVAATAVANLIRSFATIDQILMVGIAGGVPDPNQPEEHVRLGDVVVSNEHGILQYDNTKQTPDNIVIRDSTPKPSATLISAAKALEAERLLGNSPWENYLARGDSLEDVKRLPADQDVLHDSHAQDKKIPHPDDPWRDRYPDKPRIHLGVIGSANTLLKDALKREMLRDKYDVRAIEMEGSGTAHSSWNSGRGYIVIRGICDYCDTHKNNLWQPYAALVAAAYARALIEKLTYFQPRRREDIDSLTTQPITTHTSSKSIATSVEENPIKQLRSKICLVYADKLESIRRLRWQGDLEVAWDALMAELVAFPGSHIPETTQAHYYYHAARWAQEDDQPQAQAENFYQTALRLSPDLDDRTYRAFKAASKTAIDEAIEILQPLDSEPVVISLLKYILESNRDSEADGFIEQLKTPVTDEIRRFHTLCRLAIGDTDGAWGSLEPALSKQADSILFQLTAGYIAFWQDIPSVFHKLGMLAPPVFQLGLISFDANNGFRLRQSLKYFEKAQSLLREKSHQDLKRAVIDAYIAASLLLPEKHQEVVEVAERELVIDAIAHVPALCLLQLDVKHDWTVTLNTLTTCCDNSDPPLDLVDLLAELFLHTNQAQTAWLHLSRFKQNYVSSDKIEHWLELAFRCLTPLGRLDELEKCFNDLGDSAPLRRIKAGYWGQRGETDRALALAEGLVYDPGDRLDYINLVHLHRQARMWLELIFSAECFLRQDQHAPGDIAGALAMAWMEFGKPETALSVLQRYRDRLEQDDYLRSCLAAHTKMGQYPEAWEAVQGLWGREPNEQLLIQRSQLQILMGEIPAAMEILKQGLNQGFESPRVLLTIAHHSLTYDREEAFHWATQAVERYPNDARVRVNAMHIAFDTGHSDWASMQMGHLRNDYPDSELLQEVTFPQMLEWTRKHKVQSNTNWRRFLDAEIPIHLWVDSHNASLGAEIFWRWHHNRARSIHEHVPLPLAYGGRPTQPTIQNWEGRSLSMDYSALIMAHLLKLFSALEVAFNEIHVPPCMFGIIQHEIQRLVQVQIDHIETSEQLLAHLDTSTIILLQEPALDSGDFGGLQPMDRIQWRLAKENDLWIVEDQFATETFQSGLIPVELEAHRIRTADVLAALKALGELTVDEGELILHLHRTNSPNHVTKIKQGCGLLVDRPFLELLIKLDALKATAHNFRLYCVESIHEQLHADVESYRYRQKIKTWLEKLLAELKRLRFKGKLKTLTLRQSPSNGDNKQPLTHELVELFIGVEGTSRPVWIDDRFITSYPLAAERAPIIGVHEVLAVLHARRAIAISKFHECLRVLGDAGADCCLPSTSYLVHELKRARVASDMGNLIENQPLTKLRAEVASKLDSGSILGTKPIRSGMLSEGTQYRLELHKLAISAMVAVWTDRDIEPRRRHAMADWLYYRFPPQQARVVGQAHFKDDAIQGLALEHSIHMSLPWRFIGQSQATFGYYQWLFPHLELAWRYNHKLRDIALSRLAELILDQFEGLSTCDHGEVYRNHFAEPLGLLPNDILNQLLAHPRLEPKLAHYFTSGTSLVGLDLFISQDEWRGAVNKCIQKSGPERSICMTIQERRIKIEFNRENGVSDAVIVTCQTANGQSVSVSVLVPFGRLEHPAEKHRLSWLEDVVQMGLLDQDMATRWQQILAGDEYDSAVDALRKACERSGDFFFSYASEVLGIPEPPEESWGAILPANPETFKSVIIGVGLSFDSSEEPSVSSIGRQGFEDHLSVLSALPYGPPWDFATAIKRAVATGVISIEDVLALICKITESNSNPIVLQNLLAFYLRFPELVGLSQLQTLLRTLLTSYPTEKMAKVFDLYIDFLHLIWRHLQTSTDFSGTSYEQSIVWAYSYADRMMNSILGRSAKDDVYMTVVQQAVKHVSEKLKERLNPFEDHADDQIDVTLPSVASRWSTVIGGTLGVLKQNAAALEGVREIIGEYLEPVLKMCSTKDYSVFPGVEFLEPTDYPAGSRNSPITNQGLSIASEYFALNLNEASPLQNNPMQLWSNAVNDGNDEFLAIYFKMLARHPIPTKLIESLTDLVENIIKKNELNDKMIPLYMGVAALLGRLVGERVEDLRMCLVESCVNALRGDSTLWVHICEISFQMSRYEEHNKHIDIFISVLGQVAKILATETKEYGEFIALVKKVEAYLPPSSWNNLWAVAENECA